MRLPVWKKVIEQRLATGTGIGFGAEVKSKSEKAEINLLTQVEPEDLVKYGFNSRVYRSLAGRRELN